MREYHVYAMVRREGAIGVFTVKGFLVLAPEGATADEVQAAWFAQHGPASNAPVRWQLQHFSNCSSIRVEPFTAYRDGNGNLRRITGPAEPVDGVPCFASVEGEHYAIDGRLVVRQQTAILSQFIQALAPVASWGNLARFDLSQRYHPELGWGPA